MQVVKTLILVSCMAILFSGCSFEKAQKATRQQAQASVGEKMNVISQKQSLFDQTIELRNVSEQAKSMAYAFKKTEGLDTIIDVEAMLTNQGKQIYDVWLRDNDNNKVHLGAMQYNRTDDYSLSFKTANDVSKYQTILISREELPDDKIETIIMMGAFSTASDASASASSRIDN